MSPLIQSQENQWVPPESWHKDRPHSRPMLLQPVNSFALAALWNMRLSVPHVGYETTWMTTKEDNAGVSVHFNQLSRICHFLGPQQMEVGKAGFKRNWTGRDTILTENVALRVQCCLRGGFQGTMTWAAAGLILLAVLAVLLLPQLSKASPKESLVAPALSLGLPQVSHSPATKGALIRRFQSAPHQGLPIPYQVLASLITAPGKLWGIGDGEGFEQIFSCFLPSLIRWKK